MSLTSKIWLISRPLSWLKMSWYKNGLRNPTLPCPTKPKAESTTLENPAQIGAEAGESDDPFDVGCNGFRNGGCDSSRVVKSPVRCSIVVNPGLEKRFELACSCIQRQGSPAATELAGLQSVTFGPGQDRIVISFTRTEFRSELFRGQELLIKRVAGSVNAHRIILGPNRVSQGQNEHGVNRQVQIDMRQNFRFRHHRGDIAFDRNITRRPSIGGARESRERGCGQVTPENTIP